MWSGSSRGYDPRNESRGEERLRHRVGGDVDARTVISGSPAFDRFTWLRAVTAFPKLPEILRTMQQLEKRLAVLESEKAVDPHA